MKQATNARTRTREEEEREGTTKFFHTKNSRLVVSKKGEKIYNPSHLSRDDYLNPEKGKDESSIHKGGKSLEHLRLFFAEHLKKLSGQGR